MVSDRKLRTLYTEAYGFLENRIGQEALETKLDHYRHYKADNMHDVFWHMVSSLTNKRSMPTTIGPIDALSPFLFDFDPSATYAHYSDDWRHLFTEIQDNYEPPGKMDIKNKASYWVMFTKGIVSGAAFLSQFDSFTAFDGFVNSFSANHLSISALPILLEQEIFNFGFPLACDFLKETGYSNYAKPDTHTIAILFETGIAPSRDNFEVFKTMLKIAEVNNDAASVIDRLLWLIGSGKYVGENETIRRQKAAFIAEIKPKLKAI